LSTKSKASNFKKVINQSQAKESNTENQVETNKLINIQNQIKLQELRIDNSQIEIKKQINLFHHNLALLKRKFQSFIKITVSCNSFP
jgi:hypothetical protein